MKKLLVTAAVLIANSAHALPSGRYERPSGISTDVLMVYPDGSVSLEHTSQVGGPGGISIEGVVPYPTICRVKEWGKIVMEDSQWAQYEVAFVHLTDLSGLSSTDHCARYVGEFNGRAATLGLRFSIQKSDFTKVK